MPVTALVSVNTVTIGAQYVALSDFCQQAAQRDLGVLADVKQLVTARMVKIQRRRMRVISAFGATALYLDAVYKFTALSLKSTRPSDFVWRVSLTTRRAVFLPCSRRRKFDVTSYAVCHGCLTHPLLAGTARG